MKKLIWLEQNDTRLINGFDFPKAVSRKPPPVDASVTSAPKAARKTKETRNARHRLNGQGTLLVGRGRMAVSGRAVRPLRKRLSSDMPGHSTNRRRSADFSDRFPLFFIIELPRKNEASKWRRRTLLETSTWKRGEKWCFWTVFCFLRKQGSFSYSKSHMPRLTNKSTCLGSRKSLHASAHEQVYMSRLTKKSTCLGSRTSLHASAHEKVYMPRLTKQPLVRCTVYWRRIDHHRTLHVATFAPDSGEPFTADLSLYGSTCETWLGRVDFVPRNAAYFHTWMCVATCTITLGIVCHSTKVEHMLLCCAWLSVFSYEFRNEKGVRYIRVSSDSKKRCAVWIFQGFYGAAKTENWTRKGRAASHILAWTFLLEFHPPPLHPGKRKRKKTTAPQNLCIFYAYSTLHAYCQFLYPKLCNASMLRRGAARRGWMPLSHGEGNAILHIFYWQNGGWTNIWPLRKHDKGHV